MELTWQIARDPLCVHRLIEESDRAAALRSATPVPRRRLESTRALVGRGLVHLGTQDGVPVVTVTVGAVPSFDTREAGLPDAEHPWYLQRLALAPHGPEPLLGVRAARHAAALATAAGADALRAEANPGITDVLGVLTALGFTRHATVTTGTLHRTFLQLALRPDPRAPRPPRW
ncbi:hypothetical protein [Streptomyces sp. NPDC056670]|uniref:hypothetical protein n=1 Tax=Streptomyces sp. NPDC056670 TaxID=3345904 RepID=UPI00367AC668